MFEIAVSIIISFSFGVVVGRLVRLPIGRWALLVVVLAVLVGGAYLYGSFTTLQSVKQPSLWSLLPKLW